MVLDRSSWRVSVRLVIGRSSVRIRPRALKPQVNGCQASQVQSWRIGGGNLSVGLTPLQGPLRPPHGRPCRPAGKPRRDPFGQHRSRLPAQSRCDLAGRLPTAPEPLVSGQHHRSATDRQGRAPDRAPARGLGSHPAAHATDHGDRRLHLGLPLAAYHPRNEDLEAVQAEQRRPRRTTVLTPPETSSCWTSYSASCVRSQVCPDGASTSPSAAPWPTFHGEEPVRLLAATAGIWSW
jgi:hypothetical protein